MARYYRKHDRWWLEKWGEYDSFFSVSVLHVFTQNYKMHSQALKQDRTWDHNMYIALGTCVLNSLSVFSCGQEKQWLKGEFVFANCGTEGMKLESKTDYLYSGNFKNTLKCRRKISFPQDAKSRYIFFFFTTQGLSSFNLNLLLFTFITFIRAINFLLGLRIKQEVLKQLIVCKLLVSPWVSYEKE